jgi:hypothetical protein
MPIPDEIDELVQQLSASLVPPQHNAFIAAARTALAAIPCIGPGSAYRILAPLQRQFFDPPDDARAAAGPRHHKPNRLNTLPPLEYAGDQRAVRYRRRVAD